MDPKLEIPEGVALEQFNNTKGIIVSGASVNFSAAASFIEKENENLSYLVVQDTVIQEFPSDLLSKLPHLTELEFTNNQLKTLPHTAFDKLNQIESFEMHQNDIQIIYSGTFSGGLNLRHLKLQSNSIGNIEPDAFRNATKLHSLFLDDNNIQDLHFSTFSDQADLFDLRLSRNKIHSIPFDLFEPCTELRVLDLSHNTLKNVSLLLRHQQTIDISYNPVESLTLKTVKSCPLLGTFNLIGCKSFKNFNLIGDMSIVTFDLSDSDLTGLVNFVIDEQCKIEQLFLTGSKLDHSTFLHNFSFANLVELNLDGTNINEPDNIQWPDLSSLLILSLRKNCIKVITGEKMRGCKNLSVLFLDDNQLETLDSKKLKQNVSQLKKLGLTNNKISEDEIKNIKTVLNELQLDLDK